MADKRPPRIWKQVLAFLVEQGKKLPTFTAGDLLDDLDLDYAGSAQVLKRLQTWGHVRVVGFESPAKRGRRRKVYEVTDHGRRAANHHARQEARP